MTLARAKETVSIAPSISTSDVAQAAPSRSSLVAGAPQSPSPPGSPTPSSSSSSYEPSVAPSQESVPQAAPSPASPPSKTLRDVGKAAKLLWPPQDLAGLDLDELTPDKLRLLLPPPGYFPTQARSSTPKNPETLKILQPMQYQDALVHDHPWKSWKEPLGPISFDPDDPRFAKLKQVHTQFLARRGRDLWCCAYTPDLTRAEWKRWDPKLKKTITNGYSHRHEAFRPVCRELCNVIKAGHCDLDILLDPYFVYFPRVPGLWRPVPVAPGNYELLRHVREYAVQEPWRAYYLMEPLEHPTRRNLEILDIVDEEFLSSESESEDLDEPFSDPTLPGHPGDAPAYRPADQI